MQIDTNNCPLSLIPKFVAMLNEVIGNHEATGGPITGTAITINLKDPDYSLEAGGYRPQEIRIEKDGGISYCTEFTYFGQGPFAELGKAIDFDFGAGVFGHMGQDFPLRDGRELFRIWQENTTAYYRSGVYQVRVTKE